MNDWLSFSQVEEFLESYPEIELSFNEYGLVGFRDGKRKILDIYDMKGNNPDWEKGFVECKIEDVKDFLAIFFKDWNKKLKELNGECKR